MERHRVMLGNIDPDLWAQVKAEAALAKRSVSDWVANVLADAVEDAEDIRISLERMNDGKGTISYEEAEELLSNAGAVSSGLPKRRVQRARTASQSRSAARSATHRRVAV